ncbi:MAG: hypothetical protein A2Y25_04290 [Candidatus Melainabacteria bacterium GWF2_37_15]|nr:MAG: hypothetical protein A2Y25_04290 [Candidatus Melainabacteria bacterium GWF2_37_15]
MKNGKIISIGEVLVDWTCLNKTLDLNEANEFIKLPGGAPANVAVGLAKQGYPVQFIGGFSQDIFGEWLKNHLNSLNVDVSHSQTIENAGTRCAYVLTDKNGNRVFKGFSKSLCADTMLEYDKIDLNNLKNASIIYFGSFIQACEKSRNVIKRILENTKNDNIKVYDPNLRPAVWSSVEEAVNVIKQTIKYVDVLKLSDDEVNLVSGIENNIESAAEKVFNEYSLKLLVITMGEKGSFYINKNGRGYVQPFKVPSVEMTGAGDGFVSGLIGGIYEYINTENQDIENIASEEISFILTKANAVGALATIKPGAMSALPTRKELEEFLAK